MAQKLTGLNCMSNCEETWKWQWGWNFKIHKSSDAVGLLSNRSWSFLPTSLSAAISRSIL